MGFFDPVRVCDRCVKTLHRELKYAFSRRAVHFSWVMFHTCVRCVVIYRGLWSTVVLRIH
jgi:hypothetical protein